MVCAGHVEDARRSSRWTTVCACTSGDRHSQQGGEASASARSDSIRPWGGNPPVFYQPVLVGHDAAAQNPQTGEILPATFIGLIVPGTGYSCTQVHHRRDAVRDQRHRDADETAITSTGGGEGFIEPPADSVRPARRYGVGAQSAHGHSCRGRIVPRRHGRRVRRSKGRASPISSTGRSSTPTSTLPDRRRRGISGAEYERPGSDGQPAAEQPPLHHGDSARNRQEHRRRCGVCRHEKQVPGARDATSTRFRSCAGSIRHSAIRRSPRRPRIPGRCRMCSCVRFSGFSDINHHRADRMADLRLAPAAGDPPVHGPLRDGGQLHLGARLRGHVRAAEWRQPAAIDDRPNVDSGETCRSTCW